MADIDNVAIAIRNLLVNDNTVKGFVSTRVYNKWRTGTGSTYPRVNFGMISHTVNENDIHDTLWQFSIFDDDADVNNAQNISLAVEAVLHWTNFAITGWECHWCEKVNSTTVGVDDQRIVHVADDYLIRLRPTA